MRAMVLEKPGMDREHPLTAMQLPDPSAGDGQIRLRVSACGVCHTDLHMAQGELDLPKLPVVPGHQIVGRVDGVGAGAGRFQPGQRVGVGWLGWACGQCEFCSQGLENLCRSARFTGLHVDGGYAEYVVVDERYAYALPQSLSDVQAAPLLCAGIIGYRALRLSGIQPGGRLGLYGFGASAHIAIQVARHWGCRVYAFSRGEEHRKLAMELGAVWSGSAEESPPAALDAAVTFAPAGGLVPVALSHLRPGGTLAINAVYMSAIPEMPYERVYGERVVRSVANFTRRDAEEFLDLAARIPVRSEVEVLPLEQANEALGRVRRSQVRGSMVLTLGQGA